MHSFKPLISILLHYSCIVPSGQLRSPFLSQQAVSAENPRSESKSQPLSPVRPAAATSVSHVPAPISPVRQTPASPGKDAGE